MKQDSVCNPGTITIQHGSVRLACPKGTAEIAVPSDSRSVLAYHKAVLRAVEDLILIAKPSRCRLVLMLPSADLSRAEAVFADEIRLAAGLKDIFWATCEDYTLRPIVRPTSSRTEQAGWELMEAGSKVPAGKLQISQGSITLEWKGKKATEAIPLHSRLLIADFCALTDALIRAKRLLGMKHGTKVEMHLGSDQQTLTPIEAHVVWEAALESKLKFDRPNSVHTRKDWAAQMQRNELLAWAVFGPAFILAACDVIPVSPAAIVAIGLIFGIGQSMRSAWRERRDRVNELSQLLRPNKANESTS